MELGGGEVADEAGHTYTVPAAFALAPADRVALYTGDGPDNVTGLWGSDGAVWNNDGDTVIVRTANGTPVLERAYD